MSASRSRLVAVVVLLALALVLVAVALATSGGSKVGGLRIEARSGQISVFVKPEDNKAEAAANKRSVTLECRDQAGKVVHSSQQGWPFGDTDGGVYDPHQHVGVSPGVEGQVSTCRLLETELEGRLR